MKDVLGTLVNRHRKIDRRITNDNKDSVIKEINKVVKEYGMSKISPDAKISDVTKYKNEYLERISYDITTLAINEGNRTIAEIYGRELKQSSDKDTRKLGKFSKDLANAKYQSNKHLNKGEKAFLERGNLNIEGYGNKDIVTLFEAAKTERQVKELIEHIKNNNPKDEFYNKQIDTFQKVFQKIGIVRENDINKLTNKLNNMNFLDLNDITKGLLQSLEMYGSDDNDVGIYGGEETELANARLDDMLIRLGLKASGQAKVNKILNKYKK